MAKKVGQDKYVGCVLKDLPESKMVSAARIAVDINPSNAPRLDLLSNTDATRGLMASPMEPQALAALTGKYWGAEGVKLGVSFMDNPTAGLRNKILAHMNAWGEFCNVSFSWSQSGGEVRISRGSGGYYSYLGTDVLSIPKSQQTMNLQGFTERTPDDAFIRVVRHETGHTCAFPHEHLRPALVAKLNVQKTLAYFRRTQGWDEQTTRSNVLTPVSESSILGSEETDDASIMCYPLPGEITKDGRPIPGGSDFSEVDRRFAAKLYPKVLQPPPPGPGTELVLILADVVPAGKYVLKRQD